LEQGANKVRTSRVHLSESEIPIMAGDSGNKRPPRPSWEAGNWRGGEAKDKRGNKHHNKLYSKPINHMKKTIAIFLIKCSLTSFSQKKKMIIYGPVKFQENYKEKQPPRYCTSNKDK